LSHYLRCVRLGETIEVVDRETPIARLVPVEPGSHQPGSWAKRLQRSGLVRVGPMKGVRGILKKEPSSEKTGVLEALLEERRENR
jgi:antitoxin (DNA-binding transcriptional repressor) of toxin-antitoxin stability system